MARWNKIDFLSICVHMAKTVVAFSGGVDSGVSSALLLDRGDEVCGLFLRHRYQKTINAEETYRFLNSYAHKVNLSFYSLDFGGNGTRLEWSPNHVPFLLPVDLVSAIGLASYLGIDLVVVDVDQSFSNIVDDFVEKYYSACTPNPCVLCNRNIKFTLLWQFARQQLGADKFATGHYVRSLTVRDWLHSLIDENRGVGSLLGFDSQVNCANIPTWLREDLDSTLWACSLSSKDQTYFLYGVPVDVLPFVEFPIGIFNKTKVRTIAFRKGLPVADKKDSQEVCFVHNKQHVDFIQNERKQNPQKWEHLPVSTSGSFLSLDDEEIGVHSGYEKFTIGQRKGLGRGFVERMYVQQILPERRSVVLGPHEALRVTKIKAVESNWHVRVPSNEDFRCEVRVRYRNESCSATVRVACDGSMCAILDSPQYGVAPGQALVCYWQDRLLGGARIIL